MELKLKLKYAINRINCGAVSRLCRNGYFEFDCNLIFDWEFLFKQSSIMWQKCATYCVKSFNTKIIESSHTEHTEHFGLNKRRKYESNSGEKKLSKSQIKT